jgi:flavorubredoxin
MRTTITEVAPEVFRIGVYVGSSNENISCFLIRDELPAMVDTNLGRPFQAVREAVASLIDVSTLRYIFLTSVAIDAAGGANGFLDLAPDAEVRCSPPGLLSVSDLMHRPPRVIVNGERTELGAKTIVAVQAPWVPNWDSMYYYDDTDKVLFATDLFITSGSPEAVTHEDLSESMINLCRRSGAFPSVAHVEQAIERFEAFDVEILASMHGPCLAGDPKRYYEAARNGGVAGLLDAPLYNRMDFEVKT